MVFFVFFAGRGCFLLGNLGSTKSGITNAGVVASNQPAYTSLQRSTHGRYMSISMLNTKQATLNASRRKLHASTNSRSSTTRSPTPTHPEHPRGSLTWRMRGMKALVLSVQQSASAGASKDGFAEKSFARYRKKRAVEEFGRLAVLASGRPAAI